MGYLLPFDRNIRRSQDFGANPGWGPNPPGGHNGDDWATPVGTPVRAAGDGEVVFAGEFDDSYADNWGWNLHYGGKMVILNMDGDTAPYFEYGHNSQVLVKAGQRVKRGQVIAITGNTDGNTGVSTGPHCHVGCLPHDFNLGSSTYGRVNPRLYMTDYPDATGSLSYASESITPVSTTTESEEDFMGGKIDAVQAESMVQETVDRLFAKLNGKIVINPQQAEDIVQAAVGRVVSILKDGTIDKQQADDIARAAAQYNQQSDAALYNKKDEGK